MYAEEVQIKKECIFTFYNVNYHKHCKGHHGIIPKKTKTWFLKSV